MKLKPQSHKVRQNETAKNISHRKDQDETPEQLSELEIAKPPEKEFKIIILKMIQDIRKQVETRIKKIQKLFNKDLEKIKKKQRLTIQ